jgi:protein-S-isoprenylcysteine O-methyltransferase Ste14
VTYILSSVSILNKLNVMPSLLQTDRLKILVHAVFNAPPGRRRIFFAVFMGIICHVLFTLAVLSMITAMFFGMSRSFGTVPWPFAIVTNALLILQFPLAHSWLLTRRGGRTLTRLIPGPDGTTLATTTYAIVASAQLVALFALWTPSGVIWLEAEGVAFWIICIAYVTAWLMLIKASFDAGAEVQLGALGWMSLAAKVKPVFPDMPTTGLFRVIRQPIYVAFALTLWTVPVWTPDQLALALSFTAYCLLAPLFKEQRFLSRYGSRFARYREQVPYAIPRMRRQRR